jgi:hypothetical protein
MRPFPIPDPIMAGPFACKESGNLSAPTRGMRILSSSPTHPLAGLRLTGFGTLPVRLRRTRLPQFHRASPSTALDKKRRNIISQILLSVKAPPLARFLNVNINVNENSTFPIGPLES